MLTKSPDDELELDIALDAAIDPRGTLTGGGSGGTDPSTSSSWSAEAARAKPWEFRKSSTSCTGGGGSIDGGDRTGGEPDPIEELGV